MNASVLSFGTVAYVLLTNAHILLRESLREYFLNMQSRPARVTGDMSRD